MATTDRAETEHPSLGVKTPATRGALRRLIDALPDDVLPQAAQLLDTLVARTDDSGGQVLMARWIERNPHKPWLDEARLVKSGVPVWALVGHLRSAGGGVAEAARAFDVPEEAVAAALAFYRRHRVVIDARIEANAAQLEDPL